MKFGARFSMLARTASVWFAVPISACCSKDSASSALAGSVPRLLRSRFAARIVHFVDRHSSRARNRFTVWRMKNIEVSDAVYDALQGLASGFHRTPDEVLANPTVVQAYLGKKRT